MVIEAYGKTDVGKKRQTNQDSILLNPEHHIYAVADGMGGHKGGGVASAMAVQILQEVLIAENQFSFETRLEKAYVLANERIYQRSHKPENKDLEGMGTTLVSLVVTPQRVYVSNVGDSRAYLYREGLLWQITEDHSLIQEQIRAGLLKPEKAGEVLGKNVITRSVGFDPNIKVDVVFRDYYPGDIFLLCSDGLTGMLENKEIAEILNENSLDQVSRICVDRANEAGGIDNVSCMVISLS